MSITKYEEGSLKELLSISLPLMISTFSVMSMLFVDRLLLAHYSTAALNASVNASTLGWALLFAWVVLTNISEVFVAQYCGSNQLKRLGEPVWQMLWLSLASCAFFIPMAIWGSTWVYGPSADTAMERIYFTWMLIFGPTFAAYSALSGFFVGQGKTKLITWLSIIANIINGLLDVCLIFGVDGVIPSLGIEGAAISTSIGSFFQTAVLFYFFLKKENRENFGSSNCKFIPKAFWQCFKVGLPGAVFALVEVLGWAAFYSMMSLVSEVHITIAGICQSLFILLICFSEGIGKAATAIAGNMIGAKRTWHIPSLIRSGIIIHIGFFIILLLLFFSFHHVLINQFLPTASPEYIASIEASLNTCLFITMLYIFFESVRWLYSGILTAAGDTTFLMISGSLSIWLLLVLPVYVFVVLMHASIEIAIFFWLIFSVGACAIYYWRYKTGVWKTKSIISEPLPLSLS
jgi:multidrug resistance protein, MATE family